MKILVACGSGLGSSFMIEMNIRKIIKELGVEAEVSHTDLSTAKSEKADIYVGTRDIADQLIGLGGEVISLKSMIDFDELKDKLKSGLGKKGLI
ncbi:PTS sugar transporter subunit IIB [Sporosalibacterium faouarense]|uniref:PTS sugar transporter subunit IIB n=1 Tax=Sporosalibacterium faouarense TaxID=516123 RepID=UPI00311C9E5B